MLDIFRLMKDMKIRIDCDKIEFKLEDEDTLKIIASRGGSQLQRSYSSLVLVKDPKTIVDSCVTYMSTAFHPTIDFPE